jgi:hypothetical protein
MIRNPIPNLKMETAMYTKRQRALVKTLAAKIAPSQLYKIAQGLSKKDSALLYSLAVHKSRHGSPAGVHERGTGASVKRLARQGLIEILEKQKTGSLLQITRLGTLVAFSPYSRGADPGKLKQTIFEVEAAAKRAEKWIKIARKNPTRLTKSVVPKSMVSGFSNMWRDAGQQVKQWDSPDIGRLMSIVRTWSDLLERYYYPNEPIGMGKSNYLNLLERMRKDAQEFVRKARGLDTKYKSRKSKDDVQGREKSC